MKRVVLGALVLLTAAACSPEQERIWLRWFHREPKEAVRWAVEECGDLCTEDWDRDGVVEPEPEDESEAEPAAVEEDVDEPDQEGGADTAGVYWPWTELAECESGGNWSINTGNGYYGGLQFALGSWQAAGGSGLPSEASPSEQVFRGEILQDMQGWDAWPTCARIIGLL